MFTQTGDYKLAATYCEPDNGKSDTLQILTHGIGFDRHYWDFPYNNYNYSYVEQAVDQHGYSTLAWDRLGIGMSSRGDPINEIQVHLEVAALHALTMAARDGKLSSCLGKKFKHIQHAGHSFGSVITYAATNMWPDMSEAIALTGFSQVGNFIAYFGLGGNFAPVKENEGLKDKYPVGYLAPKSSIGVHINFFAPGDFDPEILPVAAMTGQPVSVGELLTVAAPVVIKNSFPGRVFIITGEYDIPFCGGDCKATAAVDSSLPDLLQVSKPMFPNAASFETKIVDGAGHGLNYQYTHVSTYSSILDFFGST
jgi:pimeloyl-ACP methyl ester carboxylesterase